jgi:hypothetical protein
VPSRLRSAIASRVLFAISCRRAGSTPATLRLHPGTQGSLPRAAPPGSPEGRARRVPRCMPLHLPPCPMGTPAHNSQTIGRASRSVYVRLDRTDCPACGHGAKGSRDLGRFETLVVLRQNPCKGRGRAPSAPHPRSLIHQLRSGAASVKWKTDEETVHFRARAPGSRLAWSVNRRLHRSEVAG